MKAFVKRTLLFTVLVLCLFAISVLAASAAPTGATSDDGTSAAYYVFEGAPYYYASYSEAITDALANGVFEITLLKDASASSGSAIKVVAGNSLTIKGEEGANITLTVTATSGISVAGELTLENMTISIDKLDPAIKCYEGSVITFKNAVLMPKQSYPISGTTDASHTFEFINSTIDFDGVTTDATYLIFHEGVGTLRLVADGLTTEISVAKLTSSNSTLHADLKKVTKMGATIAGLNIGNPKKVFVTDDTAKVFGYNYRVADTQDAEGGKPEEVYFKTCAEAFAAANSKKVWNVSGATAVEVDQATYNPDIDFQNDGEAKSAGYCFRVGETEGGDMDVVYFNDLIKAVEAVADGGTIYVIDSIVVESSECPLTKSVSFVAFGVEEGQFYAISKSKENSTNFFSVSDATPVTVTFENVFFSTAAVQGYLFSVEGAGSADIRLKNGGMSFLNCNGFRVQGNATAKITIEGGEYTAYTLFNFTGNATVELNVSGGTVLASTGSASDSAIFYVDTAGEATINLKDIEMKNSAGDSPAIWLMKTATVDFTMENVYIKVKSFCMTSDDTVVARVNLTNVTFISTEATPVRLRGAKGSYTNIFSGSFLSLAPASTFNSINGFAIVNFGGNMSANFYDGYFSSEIAPLISALNTTVTINIYGGTYACTSVDGTTSPISLPAACTLNIYGGTFRNASRVSPVFSNVTDSRGSLTLFSYHAYGNANLIVNLGKGTPSALHTGIGSSSLNAITATRGATPVFNENTITGLSFKATVSADTLQYFQNMALEGAVNFGMLVIPTNMLSDGMTFSHYGLSSKGLVLGEDFFNVDASAADIEVLSDGSLVITLSYAIAQENFGTAYSVVFYADLVDAESNAPFYFYSAYDKAENSRSVAQVAGVAYNSANNGYTAEQLAALEAACGGDTAQKMLDIYLLAGGSNAVGNTPYSNNFANAFDPSAISANVFYSGMISERASQTYGKNTFHYMATQHTAIGATPSLDLGWAKGTMGFEVGMAQKLSELYAAGSDNYAAIIKFAANDATLAGADAADAGNWSNLYDTFIALLEKQIADYASLGYEVNIVGMYWIQGEKDVAHVAAYESALNALIDNVREDLSDITGADLSDMPVVIGEIATFLNLKTNDANTAFVAQQNEMASTENNVIVDPTSLYMADANGVFTTPSELVSIGARVAATLVKNGISAIDPATVEIPAVEFVADIIVAGSEPTSVTSIAMALAVAPNGSTIKLNVDLDLQATINLDGINGITLDGNGKTISVNFDDMAFTLKNSNVVFHNIKLTHNGANVGFKLDNDAKLFLTGSSTNVVTNLTAFELTGKNAQLVIANGTFKTLSSTSAAMIYTTSGDVEIKGGNFEAATDTSCVVIDRNAPSRLAVNIEGGSFKTTTSGSTKPAAFVNECPVAILAIAPAVAIDAGATVNNGISQ